MTPAQADTMARQLAAALGPNSPSDDQLDVAEQWYDLAAPEQDQVIAAAARLRLNLTGRRTWQVTVQTIESQAARAQVLSYYRKLRHAGLSPADTMAQLRDGYAHYIALAVSRGATPAADTLECWTAAHHYSMSMVRRPLWWWRAH